MTATTVLVLAAVAAVTYALHWLALWMDTHGVLVTERS
jgi:hypothetical protein